jgi:hypothetical protein
MRCWLALALSAAVYLAASQASAQDEQEEWDGGYDYVAERRFGFTAGLGAGLALGRAVGYPNVAGQIGSSEYEADTGLALGDDYTLWLGGALKDWFTVAVGMNLGGIGTDELVTGGWGFFFRVETFPLFYEGGFWEDFGVQANFGIGAEVIVDQDQEEVANGGAMSVAGLGAVYEAFHFGSFAAGPTLEYRYSFSQSLSQHIGIAGMRIVFYGGP